VVTTKREGIERELEAIHPDSFGWALTCCGWDRDQAKETLQTAYLKVIEGRARFNGHSSLKTWFFGVVRNTAAERRRGRLMRSVLGARLLERRPDPRPQPTPELLAVEAEAQRELRRLLGRLSPRQRQLLHLVFYQELSLSEASDVLGLTLGTARTHYERGKKRLRGMLAEVGETQWTDATIATSR
jgi:RNA polymerase sigma-70 factor (ECF subfamily)